MTAPRLHVLLLAFSLALTGPVAAQSALDILNQLQDAPASPAPATEDASRRQSEEAARRQAEEAARRRAEEAARQAREAEAARQKAEADMRARAAAEAAERQKREREAQEATRAERPDGPFGPEVAGLHLGTSMEEADRIVRSRIAVAIVTDHLPTVPGYRPSLLHRTVYATIDGRYRYALFTHPGAPGRVVALSYRLPLPPFAPVDAVVAELEKSFGAGHVGQGNQRFWSTQPAALRGPCLHFASGGPGSGFIYREGAGHPTIPGVGGPNDLSIDASAGLVAMQGAQPDAHKSVSSCPPTVWARIVQDGERSHLLLALADGAWLSRVIDRYNETQSKAAGRDVRGLLEAQPAQPPPAAPSPAPAAPAPAAPPRVSVLPPPSPVIDPGLPDCPGRVDAVDARMLTCNCSSRAATLGEVHGTMIYTSASSICRAALHAGVISADGGTVRTLMLPAPAAYRATLANGVQSGERRSGHSAFTFVPPR
jgi:hypothetical protein